jgi:DNA-binding transcriptional LysR family regulator
VKFPGSLFFQELSNEETVQAVLNLQSEIGIVHKVPDHFELTAKDLFKEEFQLVIPKKMMAKRPTLDVSLFSQLKLIPSVGYRPEDELIKSACSYSDLEMKSLKMIRATESYQSLKEMVESSWGWAVLPKYLEVSESKNWILPLSSKALPSRRFFIIYRKEFASVPWFKALIADIRHCFTEETES